MHRKPPRDLRDEDFISDIDLDGDGTMDIVVREKIDATFPEHTYRYRWYVRRKDCSHYVGKHVAYAPLRVLDSRHHGLRDLLLPYGVCNKSSTCSVTLRFDGNRYSVGGPKLGAPPMACEDRRCPLIPKAQ